ncbi:MAG: four helix bundle protein [Porphyromonadaceae bacterium]|nr:MAG: four helix bundle protein [Porphyromonadaceae bacterium]
MIIMNDLHKRLKKFAVEVYRLTLKFRKDPLLTDNINQLIRSSASPGANYGEAQSASSTKDFNYKIRLCLKEMRESHYWLHYFHEIFPELKETDSLIQETEELCKILSSIAFKTQNR